MVAGKEAERAMLTDWQLDLDELTPDLNRRASSIEYSSGVSRASYVVTRPIAFG